MTVSSKDQKDAEQLTREFQAIADGFPAPVVIYALGVTLARGMGAKSRSNIDKTMAFLQSIIAAEIAAEDARKREEDRR